ncbi:MAG: hypothetical protein JOZ96_18060 [Acidobacteria bacterium]|nr:hypothetical protein [Acidobacteriota bacterium]
MGIKQSLAEFPALNYVGLAFGLLLASGGAFLFWLARPSPHGYIELFFAIPAICAGLFFISVSLLFAYHRLHWGLKLLAAVLLAAAVFPLVEIALLLWR